MNKQNNVWEGVKIGIDLQGRIPQIVSEISKKCNFIPDKLLSTSSWWSENTGIGAFHFKGKFDGEPAVLKVQGVKPTTSEVFMIESFANQNKSGVIRPPKIFAKFPWNENEAYEAFILEDVGTNLVVNNPTTKAEISSFFDYYNEYRENCRNSPWLEKPEIEITSAIRKRFQEWTQTSYKIFPDHELRKPEDTGLINKSLEILTKKNEWHNLEFVHGHFSAKDLFSVYDQIVVLSNLYWSWRTPYYDLVFAYHWFIYNLSSVEKITPKEVEEQREIWLNKIKTIAENKELLNYALLERATAGLILDSLSIDSKNPIAKYLVEETRKTVETLIKELS